MIGGAPRRVARSSSQAPWHVLRGGRFASLAQEHRVRATRLSPIKITDSIGDASTAH